MFDVAVLKGKYVEYDPFDGNILIFKNNQCIEITYEQFDSMFYIINNFSDAALKEDCIFYKFINNGVLLKNHRGDERMTSMDTFFEMYRV